MEEKNLTLSIPPKHLSVRFPLSHCPYSTLFTRCPFTSPASNGTFQPQLVTNKSQRLKTQPNLSKEHFQKNKK
jgi:hypothetical protein